MSEVKTDKSITVKGDAFKFIDKCNQQFDFIFADPPYALKDMEQIPDLIFKANILKENGILVFEHGKEHNYEEHPNFIDQRVYGSVNFSFFKHK